MSEPVTRDEMLELTEIALRMARRIDAVLSIPDKVDLKALAGEMQSLVKRLEGTQVTLTLSSPCACEGGKVLVGRHGTLVYGGKGIGWTLHIGLLFGEEVALLDTHKDKKVRVILLEEKPSGT